MNVLVFVRDMTVKKYVTVMAKYERGKENKSIKRKIIIV